MFDALTTDMATRFLLAAAGVGLGLFVLVGILMVLRRRKSTLFVRGGKSRVPRLTVLDAAAIDARRRLVLIKRDNVEHLIMIGGPTDIVIESGIGQTSNVDSRKRIRQAAPLPRQEAAATTTQSDDFPNLLNESPTPQAEHAARPVERRQQRRQQQEAELQPREPAQPIVAKALADPVSAAGQILYASEQEPEPELLKETEEQASERDIKAFEMAIFGEELPADEAEPVVAEKAAPAPPVADIAETKPSPDIRTPIAAAATLTANAADILDAARHRVLQVPHQSASNLNENRAATVMTQQTPVYRPIRPEQPTSTGERQANAASQPEMAAASSTDRQDELAVEFEKILEAEMAANGISLDSEPTPPRRDIAAAEDDYIEPSAVTPPAQRITGARAETSLEKEMARLLGEMSVTRKS